MVPRDFDVRLEAGDWLLWQHVRADPSGGDTDTESEVELDFHSPRAPSASLDEKAEARASEGSRRSSSERRRSSWDAGQRIAAVEAVTRPGTDGQEAFVLVTTPANSSIPITGFSTPEGAMQQSPRVIKPIQRIELGDDTAETTPPPTPGGANLMSMAGMESMHTPRAFTPRNMDGRTPSPAKATAEQVVIGKALKKIEEHQNSFQPFKFSTLTVPPVPARLADTEAPLEASAGGRFGAPRPQAASAPDLSLPELSDLEPGPSASRQYKQPADQATRSSTIGTIDKIFDILDISPNSLQNKKKHFTMIQNATFAEPDAPMGPRRTQSLGDLGDLGNLEAPPGMSTNSGAPAEAEDGGVHSAEEESGQVGQSNNPAVETVGITDEEEALPPPPTHDSFTTPNDFAGLSCESKRWAD
eukprot:gene13057-15425_t